MSMKDRHGREWTISTAPREKWVEYERRKQEWIKEHGWSDPKGYDEMIRRVTKELGL